MLARFCSLNTHLSIVEGLTVIIPLVPVINIYSRCELVPEKNMCLIIIRTGYARLHAPYGPRFTKRFTMMYASTFNGLLLHI